MSEIPLTNEQFDYLMSPQAIRERARSIFDFTCEGKGSFSYLEDKFEPTVDYVLKVIEKKYPDGNIPFHSRWGHFQAGGIDRLAVAQKVIPSSDKLERARTYLDLVITSVLLDAGAGADWKYTEASSARTFVRSEGLGVASLHMFLSGVMSSNRKSIRADADGLMRITPADLKYAFQVHEKNPLLGVEGRVTLLNNLGKALMRRNIFKDGRPGNIMDYLLEKSGMRIRATDILRAVLEGFGVIWPGRLTSSGRNLGDVWKHTKIATGFDALVPFHKLSQWMTYSLIEPMLEAGIQVTGVDELTGLAEYRNGGLLLDSGLLSLQNTNDGFRPWRPDSNLVIEWRALTIYFLDRIGEEVQRSLRKTPEEFPLAKVLEGGTWWAGRFLAQEKRADGAPPLHIESDGTVF